jgi:hypothetical protein|tara:strand:+ start:138 stop:1679 length:1542 start_codon:yes stop_codon:yes gene_type:complete
MSITNTTAKVHSEALSKKVRWIYDLHKNNLLHYDRERLQRLLNKWFEGKRNSYLTTLFNGASFKDTFQLANILEIVEQLDNDIKNQKDQFEKEFLEENLEYFKNLLTKGKQYLVLDGQHRIQEIVDYFEGKTEFNPLTEISLQIDDQPGLISIKGKFTELPEEIQTYLFNTPIICVVYNTGDLTELVEVFITSNSMVAMTVHEKRILNYNKNNLFLIDTCLHYTNIKSMFQLISGMTSEYDLKNKGDTLFAAEMMCWINNNNFENQTHILDQVCGPVKSSRKSKDKSKVYISETERQLTKKILRIMADGCALYPETDLKKFSKSSLYNLFYTLAFLMQKNNIWLTDVEYSISDPELFVKMFFDAELIRLKSPGTNFPYVLPNGKNRNQLHDYSFAKHNADQKHQSKVSMKGEGGSKYKFNDYARLRYLKADLEEQIPALESLGIITKLGSRKGERTRAEILAEEGIPLSQQSGYHIDEIVPVSKGGNRTPENTRVIDSKTNMNDGNRTKRVIV